MQSEKKAKEIIKLCLNEMYKSAEPSITWDEILKKYIGVHDWQLNHSIDKRDYDRIKKKYLKKLDRIYHMDLDWFLLDYSPTFGEMNE